MEIIYYIRSLNQDSDTGNAAPTAAAPTQAADVATDVPTTFVPPDISGLPVPTSISGDAAATTTQPEKTGEELYAQSCAGCHGADGSGVPYTTGPLTDSTLIQNKDDAGLLSFLTKTEPPVNPPDHVQHPYRGGYPPLSDADLQSIIAYLYGLTTGK
jgi:mono/diheme cytochrome c family protein